MTSPVVTETARQVRALLPGERLVLISKDERTLRVHRKLLDARGQPMTVECAYCGHQGEYGSVVEIRNGKFACIDVAACDARANDQDEEEVAP